MSFLKKLFGDENEKYLKKIQPLVDEINKLEQEFKSFSDEELKKKTEEFREKELDDILPQTYALVREAAKRTLQQRHFDVQLIGGIALHQGKVTEMKTGEGKTLASTLPVYLNALKGKGVHIVTVNEYLAKRDTVWMGQIYNALGLSVSCLVHQGAFIYDPNYKEEDQDKTRDELGSFKVVESYLRPASRKEAYQADITYGTNHEFGFDYLRDNMAYSQEQKVQRGLNYAIIDEVDSVLIDEARTPLIISAPDTESSKLYREFSQLIPRLTRDKDYEIHEKEKAATLTEQGVEKIEKILGLENIYQSKGIRYLHYLEQALRANVLFQRDRDYVVKNNEIIIVDEFTGRLMPGRRWSGGLHQAMEAKEGLNVKPESLTLASISIQNYFRMYDKLAGMTGTAVTSAEEFEKVYNLLVVIIPTNKPIVRKDLSDIVYKTKEEKLEALVERIKNANQKGQPVLVGTRSIEKNESLSLLLKRAGVKHEVLNAKQHEREAEIIAQAGKLGAVTVATNMAGRGVDIVLGGNPPEEKEAEKVKQAGGLLVLGTERHEARRIDNQLRGRSGRQGDPGESQFYLSMEDDLMRIFGGDRIKNMMNRLKLPKGQPIQSKIISNAVESAQARIEGMNFDIRKHLLEYDDVMNIHRTSFYKKREEIVKAEDKNLKEKVLSYFEKHKQDKNILLKKEEEIGQEFSKVLRYICLKVYDSLWINHLSEMEYLRDRVRLRAYGQMDPLVEYKKEGYNMFKNLLDTLEINIIESISNLGQNIQLKSTATKEQSERKNPVVKKKPGRNDPCPCGAINPKTGKVYKYKNCGLINAPYHKG